MYELAAGESYRNPDAIKQPYYTLPLPATGKDAESRSAPISEIRVEITAKWMKAAHELLDYFLSCDTDTMRKIPNLIYTRVGTAVLSLLEIYASVMSGHLRNSITPQDVKVDMYLNIMAARLAEASGSGKYKIPSRWHHVIAVKGRDWHDRFQTQHSE